jgi:hypothetical protein
MRGRNREKITIFLVIRTLGIEPSLPAAQFVQLRGSGGAPYTTSELPYSILTSPGTITKCVLKEARANETRQDFLIHDHIYVGVQVEVQTGVVVVGWRV